MELWGFLNEEYILVIVKARMKMDNYKSGFFFLHSPCYVEKPASITFFQSSPESSQETLTVFCSQIFWLQCAICDHLFCSRSLWQWQWTKKQLFQKCTLEVHHTAIAEPNALPHVKGNGTKPNLLVLQLIQIPLLIVMDAFSIDIEMPWNPKNLTCISFYSFFFSL